MILEKLSVLNYKNIASAELELSHKINCFIGNNGMGKTNLLDAIYYLSFCKSYFNNTDSQVVMHGEDMLLIKGSYQRNGQEELISCGIQARQKKKFKRNQKEYTRLADHIGLLPLVMVSPSDTRLVIEGSEERRKYMNGVISQYDNQYLNHVIKYNKVLLQRNALLKQLNGMMPPDLSLFEVLDMQLVDLAQRIAEKRKQFIEELIPVFHNLYSFIAGEGEEVSLEYKSHLLEENFEQQLSNALEKDIQTGFTTKGIHKDDLIFHLNGYPIKREGSQGQRKSYLIALKLAQYNFISEVNGFSPILLLDDVFDKLDAHRVEQIVRLVSEEQYGQIFITDTNREHLSEILESIKHAYTLFYVKNGEVEELAKAD